MKDNDTKLLIFDSFGVHFSAESKLKALNTEVLFISKHLTSLLQPLDAGIFAIFKELLKKHFLCNINPIQHIENEAERRNYYFTLLDSKFTPSQDMIVKCFKKCLFENQNEQMEIE